MQDEYFNRPDDNLEQRVEEELLVAKMDLVSREGEAITKFGPILIERLIEAIGDKPITIDNNNIIDQMITMRLEGNIPYEEIIDTIVNMYGSYFG